MYTETIDVDPSTRVALTTDHTIVIEASGDGLTYARLAVRDTDGLTRALARMRDLRAGQITRDQADATAALPIDDGMRKAIFAALRDRYGTSLPRADRLDKLSLLTRRQVRSTNDLTRGEGGRILGFLRGNASGTGGTDAPAGAPDGAASPAGRQLSAARAYIRQAAREGGITAGQRDRYLAMLDEHARRGAGPASLDAIRARAIDLYTTGEICHPGLNGFLNAACLTPHPG